VGFARARTTFLIGFEVAVDGASAACSMIFGGGCPSIKENRIGSA
jgi:hypothetical protein